MKRSALEKLIGSFFDIGEKIKKNLAEKNDSLTQYIVLNFLAEQELWKIPISENDGGLGLSWADWASAVQAFISGYATNNLFEALINQSTVLYTLLQFGSLEQKKCVLPYLMQGRMGSIVSSCDEKNCLFSIVDVKAEIFLGTYLPFETINIQKSVSEYESILNRISTFRMMLYAFFATKLTVTILDNCRDIFMKRGKEFSKKLRAAELKVKEGNAKLHQELLHFSCEKNLSAELPPQCE